MIAEKKHIIRSQHIEMHFEDLNDAFGIQDRIAALFYERLQPKMEALFDDMFGKEATNSIEKLEIDCGIIPKKNWEDEWVENCLAEIKKQLRQAEMKSIPATDISSEFIFYLRHGYMPWFSSIRSISVFEEELEMTHSLLRSLIELLRDHPVAAKRLSQKFSFFFRKKIISEVICLNTEHKAAVQALVDDFILQSSRLFSKQEMIDEKILLVISSPVAKDKAMVEILFTKILLQPGKEIIEILAEEIPAVMPAEKTRDKTKENILAEDKAIYINNAGLILLHPFLPDLFERSGLTKENKWVDEQSQYLGVGLLNWMATAGGSTEEFNLPLPKILCGLDPEALITGDHPIDEELKSHAEELLGSVISQWSALKNTGIETFRHTFLQRTGKLTPVDNGLLLQVEPHAADILLGKLPWGIGIVKLPWMYQILYTEW